MGIGNKVVWAGGGMGRIHRTHSVLLVYVCACVCVCVCVCVCSKIFVTLIFHDHLHCCEIFLSRFLISFVFKQPLHLVFNKAATIVLNRISSFHIVWFSHINICVVTKQMRDKNTRIVNKWPVTKATHQPKKMNTYRLKRWNVWTTCKALNCFQNIARVKCSIVTSHLHLHLHLHSLLLSL